MKKLVSAIVFAFIIISPLLALGETSSSASSSGNASSAAAAIDDSGSSISTSGENTSASASVEQEILYTTGKTTNRDVEAYKKEQVTPTNTETDRNVSEEKPVVCDISGTSAREITDSLKEFTPINERTVKILKLMAISIIGIITIIILQLVIIVKASRKRHITSSPEDSLNKF